ncbi:OsmC family protein [Sporomusa acidovorans]|nr:OsmC family protein [Sporomusa acidovorans]
MKTRKVSIRQNKAVCMEVEARGIKTYIDEPLESGGTNLGLTPIEMLLASLGSCLAITTFIYASMQGIQIDDIRVDVEGDINTDGMMVPNAAMTTGYQNIRYHFFVKSPVSEQRIRQLIEHAEMKCPVGSTLRDGTTMDGLELTML